MTTDTHPIRPQPPASPTPYRRGQRSHRSAFVALTLVALVVAASSLMIMNSTAQVGSGSCNAPGKNSECTQFGEIWMDTRADIKGEPVNLEAEIMIYTLFEEQNTRHVLFSIRNTTGDGKDPVTVTLRGFSTPHGDLIVSRTDPASNRVDLWVDTLDVPVGTPIKMSVQVSSSERGAFVVEALVMAFDRGYDPVYAAGGKEAVLYSFTLLGVNEESHSSGVGVGSIPAPGFVAALAVLAVFGAIAKNRRRHG